MLFCWKIQVIQRYKLHNADNKLRNASLWVKEIYKLSDAVKAHQGIDAVSQAFEIAYNL